jgi:hypothetical protein
VADTPDFLSAIVDDAKLSDYLFDANHYDGWPKGRFLILAGFNENDSNAVRAALVSQAVESDVVTTTTPYGIKYECEGLIVSPTGSKRLIRSVWQIDSGSTTIRFVTFKPLRMKQ